MLLMMAWWMRVLGQHWTNYLTSCLLNTHSSLCLTSDAPKGSLKDTCPISLLELDWWAMMRSTMWRLLAPHDAPRPWWAEMVVMMGSNRWCWPYVVVHGIGGLVVSSLCVGLVARVQCKVGPLWWLNVVCKALG